MTPGQEGVEEELVAGLLFAAAAVVQVAKGAGEGEVVEAGVGYLPDEVMGVGERFVLGLGVGPFFAELVHFLADEIFGVGAVEFAF